MKAWSTQSRGLWVPEGKTITPWAWSRREKGKSRNEEGLHRDGLEGRGGRRPCGSVLWDLGK